MYLSPDHPNPVNPSLQGRFAPVECELDVERPPVRGNLPYELRGMYLRNGPNPQFTPPSRYHFLDGDGMMHGVQMRDGEAVRYHNRWVATQGLNRDRRAGRSMHHGFGDPKLTQRMLANLVRKPGRLLELARAMRAPGEVMEQLVQLVDAKNVANTSAIRFAGKLLALWEVGKPYELDSDLNTVGPANISDLPHRTMCAHPKVEADTGLLHAFAQRYVGGVGVKYYAYDQEWNLQEGAEVGITHPTMLHDFAVTSRHIVFVVTPLQLTFLRPFIRGGQNWNWMPKRNTQVIVMDRQRMAQGARGEDAVVCRIDRPASFLYHIGGAFTDGHEVHVDTCLYAAPPLGLGRRPTDTLYEKSYLTRLCIDTRNGTLRSFRLSEEPCAEFAHVNPHTVGHEHRYTYFAGTTTFGNDGSYTYDAIHQFDAVRGTTDSWVFSGMEVMESTFAVDPTGHDERDGWLMTTVYEPQGNTGHVAVLDARHLSAGPIAWIDLPHRPAAAFHATWLPDADCTPNCPVCAADGPRETSGQSEAKAVAPTHLQTARAVK